MKKLVICGSVYTDLIKLIDAINLKDPEWQIIGFIDDKEEVQGKSFNGYQVLGRSDLLLDFVKDKDLYFFNNSFGKKYQEKINLLDSYNCKIPNLIHPSIDMNYVKIGRGCVIPEGCVIGANTEIGNFVTIRLKSLISHDVKIEDLSFIGPGVTIGSNAILKKRCFIGAGATIMQNKTVGQHSLVGAGAVVIRDIPDETTVVGNPAKKIKRSFFKKIKSHLKILTR